MHQLLKPARFRYTVSHAHTTARSHDKVELSSQILAVRCRFKYRTGTDGRASDVKNYSYTIPAIMLGFPTYSTRHQLYHTPCSTLKGGLTRAEHSIASLINFGEGRTYRRSTCRRSSPKTRHTFRRHCRCRACCRDRPRRHGRRRRSL